MRWQEIHRATRLTFARAIASVPKGRSIFVGSGAAEPVGLVRELVAQSDRFADNTIVHLLTLGPAPYVDARYTERFRHNAFFIGPNVREAVYEGRADYTPVFLSQVPDLIRNRRMPVDVALIQTTPPDRFGYVNLGVSVDVVLAAVESAQVVIAEINSRMPWVHGSGFVPMSRIDAWVEHDSELPTVDPETPDEVARRIGNNVASLIEDGCTIQCGIGQIPDAIATALRERSDLGVWSEMLPDGVVDLMRNGNVTGRFKTVEPGKVSASFTFGRRSTYDYVDRNPTFMFHPSDYINDPAIIAKQHKMVAINSALQVDVTGQVCADSIGSRFYSGIGGQVDFIRGASRCPDGRPIVAIRSTAKNGTISRIVASLDEGAGVVTSRGDLRFLVTEYGVADLLGRSIRERAMALISVAHPDFRGELLAAAKARRYVFADQIGPRPRYHAEYEKRVRAGSGAEVLLRPLRVTDEQKMSDLFYRLSDETVHRRWMRFVPRMPHRKLLEYLKLDDVRNVAIACELRTKGTESELLGVGRYHLDPATGYAEAAFVVRDDWQGQGLGTALLRHLVEIGSRNGVVGFTAEVLASNAPMLHVFHKCGLRIHSTLRGAEYSLVMPFNRTAD